MPSSNQAKISHFQLEKLGLYFGQLSPQESWKNSEPLLLEEIVELLKAVHSDNKVAIADALGDLVYLAYGMAHQIGIPLDQVLDAIHQANMKKIRGAKPGREHVAYDVVKPEDWEGPEKVICALLEVFR